MAFYQHLLMIPLVPCKQDYNSTIFSLIKWALEGVMAQIGRQQYMEQGSSLR